MTVVAVIDSETHILLHIIMLQSSATDIMAQSSAIVSTYHTIAEF